MSAIIQRIPQQLAARSWPHAEPFVAAVEEHVAGDWTLAQMKADVLTGRVNMMLFIDAGVVVGVILYVMQNRRNGRTAFISVCGGRLITNEENWLQVKSIFVSEGATDIEAAMRPAVLRLWTKLGFKEKYRIAGVKL